MPWKLGKRDGEIVVIQERDNKVVGRHKSRKKAVAQLRALYAIEKARSFGGDRSAAGRYAAQQRWAGHVKADETGGGGGPKRTLEEKLRDGPLFLSFGRDANGLPKVGTVEELCARYGVKADAKTAKDLAPLADYFLKKYGDYGLEMVFPKKLERLVQRDLVKALPIILAGAQAVEDVLGNLDLEGIGAAVANAKAANERIKPIEGSPQAPAGIYKMENLPVVKFTMNTRPNGDFEWNGMGQDIVRLHAAAISESTISALWMLASAKNKEAGSDAEAASDKELSFQTSAMFAQQDDKVLDMTGTSFRTAEMRRAYGTMVHEWGHFLDYRLGPKGTKVGDLTQRSVARQQAGTPTFDQSPTGYGRTNPNESTAETFAAWFLFSQARYPKERGDAISRVTQRVQQDNEQMAKPLLTRAEIIKQMVRSAIAVTPNNLPLNHPVTLFTVYPFLNKIGELREAFAKARSFGGDRSEAGRYAANMRWAGNRTQETQSDASGNRFTSAMDDDRFREKYGNERLSGDGDCFEAATNLMFSQFGDTPSARLCHGVPLGRGEIEGIRFDHGWVEVEEVVGKMPDGTEMREVMVYDYSNGGEIVIPRSLYYMLGNIAPDDVKRFTAQEAMDKMRETRFYGPWD